MVIAANAAPDYRTRGLPLPGWLSALRGAVDAEVARGRALRFHDPDPRPPEDDDDAPTMGEVLRGVLRPDSRKPVEPQTNGSGEDS